LPVVLLHRHAIRHTSCCSFPGCNNAALLSMQPCLPPSFLLVNRCFLCSCAVLYVDLLFRSGTHTRVLFLPDIRYVKVILNLSQYT
jgi:hypothetical protein